MRSYAQIVPTFWTRGSGKKLRGKADAQVLALYFMSSPASNLTGLYYVPLTSICHETGLTPEQVTDALGLIGEIAKYDTEAELAWVPNMARIQVGETMSVKDRKRSAVKREIELAGAHPFVAEFLLTYGEAFGLTNPRGFADSDKGHPQSAMPPVPVPAPVPAPVPDPISGSEGGAGGNQPEPDPDPPKCRPVEQIPTSLRDALMVPLPLRAQLALERKDLWDFAEPQNWPEVKQLADAVKVRGKLGAPSRDPGVRRAVEILADFDADEAIRAAEIATKSDWWTSGGRKGLSSLSAEVIRRALPESADPDRAKRRAAAEARQAAWKAKDDRDRQALIENASPAVLAQPRAISDVTRGIG